MTTTSPETAPVERVGASGGAPTGAAAARPARTHHAVFDILRIVAALTVVVSHSYALLGRREATPVSFATYPMTWGAMAVGVFFTLSGYLIAASWQANRPGAFAIKRVLRLWPALTVVTLASVLVLGPLVTDETVAAYFDHPALPEYVWQNLTMVKMQDRLPGVFTRNALFTVNGATWSLPYEVLCYVALALVGAARLLGRRWFLLGLTVVLLAASQLVFLNPDLWFRQMPVFHIFLVHAMQVTPYFAVGAAAWAWRDRIPWNLPTAGVAVVALGAGAVLKAPALIIPAVSVLVLLIGRLPVDWRLPRWVGDPSYGIYIFGMPIQQTLISAGATGGRVSVLIVESVGLSVLAGIVSWHLVERPAMRLGNRLTRRRLGRADAAPATPGA